LPNPRLDRVECGYRVSDIRQSAGYQSVLFRAHF
jgi:hypothetical protein